ncbi:MAG TPA: VanZ family protein [Candidatus Acidoferrales bacterium]|jgi:VanZ family protein|nr:VanZ family protein [Candidatus Acidoferrales bacterium]
MEIQGVHHKLEPVSERWSNRILIAALIGIFFLTFFPFRLLSHAKLTNGVSPFLLGKSLGKSPGDVFDDFLNVLLFIPFGFGLTEKLFERRISRTTTFFIVWMGGWVVSYGIEFTQLYIPGRDSGWEDVFTNSSGSALGFLLFVTIGAALLPLMTRAERAAESFLTLRRAAVILLIYFSCCYALSARLQSETRLAAWRPDSRLLIGNDAVGKPGALWSGEVSKLEIWDRALPKETAMALTGAGGSSGPAPRALAAYELTGESPFPDEMKLLPDLSWSLDVQGHGEPSRLTLDNGKSLMLAAPVPDLVARLRRTDQFTIHVICKPAEGTGSFGQIVSISPAPTLTNLTMRQEGTSLAFWFRSALSARHSQLLWYVPNVFQAGQPRNILYSYDGSSLYLYMDGKAAAPPYRLGPGAALAHLVRRIKTNELEGYHCIYYAFLFFPAGMALGIAARASGADRTPARVSIVLLLIAPPLLFEFLLMTVSHKAFSPGNLLLSISLSALGAVWINADGMPRTRTTAV